MRRCSYRALSSLLLFVALTNSWPAAHIAAAPRLSPPASTAARSVASVPALPRPAPAAIAHNLAPLRLSAPARQPLIQPLNAPGDEAVLSLNKPASASCTTDPAFAPISAITDGVEDGLDDVRWACQDLGVHWWQVDLGQVYTVTKTYFKWDVSVSRAAYRIDVSLDGTTFTTAVTHGLGPITFPPRSTDSFTAKARFVRVTVSESYYMTDPRAVSTYEFTVFGNAQPVPNDQNNPPEKCPCDEINGTPPPGPFNPRTGYLWTEARDLQVESAGPPIAWARTYSTRLTTEVTGPLGIGWQHPYATKVITPALSGEPGVLMVRSPKGNNFRFRSTDAITWIADPGIYSTVISATNGFTLTERDQTQHVFDLRGRLIALRDPQGRQVNLTYDGTNRLTKIADVIDASRALTITYNANNRVTNVSDGPRAISYTYDITGDLIRAADVMSRPTTYAYSGTHLLARITNPLNQLVEQTDYFANGRVMSQTLQDGRQHMVSYLPESTTITTTGRDGQQDVTQITYGSDNAMTSLSLNGVPQKQVDYDAFFAPGVQTDANGNTTRTDYAATGLPLTITDPLGQVSRMRYDTQNRPISTTNALGITSVYTYNSAGNMIGTTLGITDSTVARLTTVYTYTGPITNQVLLAERGPEGVVISSTYTARPRPQVAAMVLGWGTSDAITTTYGYDTLGRVVTTTTGVGTPLARVDVTRYNADNTIERTIQNYQDGTYTSTQPDQDLVTQFGYDALARQTSISSTLGYYTSVTSYTQQGQVAWMVRNPRNGSNQPFVPTALPAFDPARPDANVATVYGYDGLNRPVLVTETGLLTGTFNVAASPPVFTATTTRVTHTAYDPLSRPLTVTLNYENGVFDPARPDQDVPTVQQYDVVGNLVTTTDVLGRRTVLGYDALNRPVTTTVNYVDGDPLNGPSDGDLVTVTRYDILGRVAQFVDTYGDGTWSRSEPTVDRLTAYQYDALDRLITTTVNVDPIGTGPFTDTNRVTVAAYNALTGQLLGQQDPLGRRMVQRYDGLSRVIATVQNCWNTTPVWTGCGSATSERNITDTVGFDRLGRTAVMTDPLGVASRMAFDGVGRVISTTTNVGPGATTAITNVTTRQRYDGLGRLLMRSDPFSGTTLVTSTMQYDALGQVLTMTDTMSRTTVMGYDGTGALRWTKRNDGQLTVSQVDGLGRVVASIVNYQDGQVTSADGSDRDLISRSTFDRVGRVITSTDTVGRATVFAYDQRDLLVGVTENLTSSGTLAPWNGCVAPCGSPNAYTYRYDRAGYRIGITDPLTHSRSFGYDAAGNLASETDGRGKTTFRRYDAVGNMTEQLDPRGSDYNLTYAYDELNRLRTTSSLQLSAPITATYDRLGRQLAMSDTTGLTALAYDPLGRTTSVTAAAMGGTIGYQYNTRGDRVGLVYPNGQAVGYDYFADGQLRSVTDTTQLLASYDYDAIGRVRQENRANGATTSYAYDAVDRVTDLRTRVGGTDVDRFQYGLDRLGLRQVVTETLGAAITATQVITRIDLGSTVPTTTSGVSWGADDFAYWTNSSDQTAAVTAITGTIDDGLYRTYRAGTTTNAVFTFTYNVPITGTYLVKLHFAEVYWGVPGGFTSGTCTPASCPNRRRFDVNIEGGLPELDDFDINAAVGPQTAVVKTFAVPVADQKLTIRFDASVAANGLDQPLVSAIEIIYDPNVIARLNSGGTPYQASDGSIWSADSGFTGGSAITTSLPISNTADPQLYQQYRSQAALITYTLGVPANDLYTVKLYFAEPVWRTSAICGGSCVGKRRFDVQLEGNTRLDNYDIVQEVGVQTAVVKVLTTTVTDRVLTLVLDARAASGGVDTALLAGIAVTRGGAEETAANVVTRLDAAGGPYLGVDGRLWAPDQDYLPTDSTAVTTTLPVSNTVDDLLYQTYRSGKKLITYTIDVPATAVYTVNLSFAEMFWRPSGGGSCGSSCAGKRAFDIRLEGSLRQDNFDIYVAAGNAAQTAVTKTYTTTVSDGSLVIAFDAQTTSGGADFPAIAAIEVLGPGGVAQQGGLHLMRLAPAPGVRTDEAQAPPVPIGNAARSRAASGRALRGTLPLRFTPNGGRTDSRVRYTAQGMGGTLFFTPQEIVLALPTEPVTMTNRPGRQPDALKQPLAATRPISLSVVRIQYEGASATSELTAGVQLPGVSNYLIGNDRTKWATNLPTYADIRYQQLYAGIDLHYTGSEGQLKTTYSVAAGADPSQIRWRYQGADNVTVDADGNLVVTVRQRGARGTATTQRLVEQAPIAWQEVDGGQVEVRARYVVGPSGRVGFELLGYDPAYPLVIDPVLDYLVILGGQDFDDGLDIAVDAVGAAYVTGTATSTDFPTTFALDVVTGTNNVFVTKLTPEGDTLVYSTIFGSSTAGDRGYGLAIDAAGAAYVTGFTESGGFPTTLGAFDETYNGSTDAFLVKLHPLGNAFVYSTYLGGSQADRGLDLAVDVTGAAYVIGGTFSSDFSTTGGVVQATFGGAYDMFVTKLNATGTTLAYSSYLGGSDFDSGEALALDAQQNLYVAGRTYSTNMPGASSSYDQGANGGSDGYIAKLNATASQLLYTTYLGGSDFDSLSDIAVDGRGQATVTGETISANYPTAGAFQQFNSSGAEDAVVTTLSADGSTLRWSTYLGGESTDQGEGVVVNNRGQVTVAGFTASNTFPVKESVDATYGGGDGFITTFNTSGNGLIWSTFVGGSGYEYLTSLGSDAQGNVYGAGYTNASALTSTPGAFEGPSGEYDGFLLKLDDTARTQPRTRVTSYQYDGLLRLIQATENPGTVYTYTYDLAGNRLAAWENGAVISAHSYNAANQVISDTLTGAVWSYDPAGNLTTDGQAGYGYDALNRLITTTAGIQTRANGYNGMGVLVAQTVNGQTTRYAQDLVAPLSQVLSSTGGMTATHLYGRDRLASVDGGNRTWYVPDALGSVRVTLNSAGDVLATQRYDPYGTPQLGGQPQPWGFTGEQHDATLGLVNLRARWYDTNKGQFFTKDLFSGNEAKPASLHHYSYAWNSPIMRSDPSGYSPAKCEDWPVEVANLCKRADRDLSSSQYREDTLDARELINNTLIIGGYARGGPLLNSPGNRGLYWGAKFLEHFMDGTGSLLDLEFGWRDQAFTDDPGIVRATRGGSGPFYEDKDMEPQEIFPLLHDFLVNYVGAAAKRGEKTVGITTITGDDGRHYSNSKPVPYDRGYQVAFGHVDIDGFFNATIADCGSEGYKIRYQVKYLIEDDGSCVTTVQPIAEAEPLDNS